MKYISKFLTAVAFTATLFSACEKKVADLPFYSNGTKVTLTTPQTAVAPKFADSVTNVLDFAWTNPHYATDSSTVKYILEVDTTGRGFTKATAKTVIGKLGTSITGRELNALILSYGYPVGVAQKMDFRVKSSYGNNNEQYISNIVNVLVSAYRDSSTLTGTASSVTCSLANANVNSMTFNWTPSFKGYAGVVSYVLQYDSAGKSFASPKEIVIGNTLYTKPMTQGEMNETALGVGVAGGNLGKVQYRVKATTDKGAIAYSNIYLVTIQSYLPLLRFYMPGGYQAATGNGNDWDPGTAPELIRDLRPGALNNLYYTYIYLPANVEFKFTQGRTWDVNYGGTGGVLSTGGANLKVTTAGVYRISIDRATLKYDIREGRMGFIGGATGAGWTDSNVFPNYALGFPATNLFVGLTTFTTGGWKLLDNSSWNNSDLTVVNSRSYGSTGPAGSSMVINADNMPDITTAGRYRVIWDGRDVNNIKYDMSPATEMRVVGDGINQAGVGDWDPGTSPQMIYNGNGVWKITITLKASKDIKFLAGNAWGAFDYEDAGGGKIKWEGGNNFKTPATAGTYLITLDENKQTVTIN